MFKFQKQVESRLVNDDIWLQRHLWSLSYHQRRYRMRYVSPNKIYRLSIRKSAAIRRMLQLSQKQHRVRSANDMDHLLRWYDEANKHLPDQEAAQLGNMVHTLIEKQALQDLSQMTEVDVNADGNCIIYALLGQPKHQHTKDVYSSALLFRAEVASFMRNNKSSVRTIHCQMLIQAAYELFHRSDMYSRDELQNADHAATELLQYACLAHNPQTPEVTQHLDVLIDFLANGFERKQTFGSVVIANVFAIMKDIVIVVVQRRASGLSLDHFVAAVLPSNSKYEEVRHSSDTGFGDSVKYILCKDKEKHWCYFDKSKCQHVNEDMSSMTSIVNSK